MTTRLATFGRTVPAIQYPQGDRVRVTQALARRMGKTEAWAHRHLYAYPTLRTLVLAAIGAYRDAEDDIGLARFSAPIRLALDNDDPKSLTLALILEAQQADGAEENAQAAYLSTPNKNTAESYMRALDREIVHQSYLRAALREHWDL